MQVQSLMCQDKENYTMAFHAGPVLFASKQRKVEKLCSVWRPWLLYNRLIYLLRKLSHFSENFLIMWKLVMIQISLSFFLCMNFLLLFTLFLFQYSQCFTCINYFKLDFPPCRSSPLSVYYCIYYLKWFSRCIITLVQSWKFSLEKDSNYSARSYYYYILCLLIGFFPI